MNNKNNQNNILQNKQNPRKRRRFELDNYVSPKYNELDLQQNYKKEIIDQDNIKQELDPLNN